MRSELNEAEEKYFSVPSGQVEISSEMLQAYSACKDVGELQLVHCRALDDLAMRCRDGLVES